MAKKSPATIAFLIDMLYEDYAIEAWKWAIEASRELGTRIIAFTGGNLKREDAENRLRNDVYGLVAPETADAIVSLSASLANTVGMGELLGFFERFKALPVIHIGIQSEGILSFRAEGRLSTKTAVQHLIDAHGKRAIAYISGPENVTDADERYSGYLDALAERGIAFDPGLVYRGDFYRETGELAVRAFMDERKKPFDALVSANDYMAVFAIRELTARGIRVPEDVAVVGYDDISIAHECSPPLTTIRQPIRELVRLAFTAASAVADGSRTLPLQADVVIVPAEFVPRRSCGCLPLAYGPWMDRADGQAAPADISDYPVQAGFDEAWKAVEKAEADGYTFPELFARVESALISHGASGLDVARPLAALVQAETERRTDRERQLRDNDALMQRIIGELLGSATADRLGRGLERVFERAGLKYYLIAEYTEKKTRARVIKSSVREWEGLIFDPRLLSPEPGENASLIVLPLYIGEESLGFFVTEGLPGRPAILELIREHLSAAILTARDEARERSRTSELEILVAERTADLEKALAEAKDAKEKVERISLTDDLTGLLNRRGFMGTAARELRLRGRQDRNIALAFIDVDGLKSINDNYGHDEGDWIIKAMARVLRDSFRSTDLIARLGGDEFTALAVDCGEEDLPRLLERITACLSSANASSGKPFKLTFSIGVALGSESAHLDLDEIMKLADMRLYQEKQAKNP